MKNIDLKSSHCVPCEGGMEPLTKEEAEKLISKIVGWQLFENNQITKTYKFKDFKDGLEFVNKVGEIAENEGHHPDVILSWGEVGITLTTHAIRGLSENDFILAAKIDEV